MQNVNPFQEQKPVKALRYCVFWGFSVLLSPIVVPARVLLSAMNLLLIAAVLGFAIRKQDLNKQLSPKRRHFVIWAGKYLIRLQLWLLGYLRIKIQGTVPDFRTTKLLVSNHVNSIDPLFYVTLGFESFVCKPSIEFMPVFGVATRSGQPIFVSQQTQQKIKSRFEANQFENGKLKFPTLVVFPEGTTTNQRALLKFKSGCFQEQAEMAFINYDQKYFDHSDASCSMLIPQLKSLVALYSSVSLEFMGKYVPSVDEQKDSKLFANNVCKYYSNQKNLKIMNLTRNDKFYYRTGKLELYNGCSEQFKLEFGPQCIKK
uniref:Acyltransferase domain-containing protein n=1 Tax=Trepomonas sp. PC1 TaxID=1076344 RepID=A0A146KKB6_9EUKA|eukprot:JAP96568.1 Acyltransferase domain-containing protein [Trepomonas sp. PC1]